MNDAPTTIKIRWTEGTHEVSDKFEERAVSYSEWIAFVAAQKSEAAGRSYFKCAVTVTTEAGDAIDFRVDIGADFTSLQGELRSSSQYYGKIASGGAEERLFVSKEAARDRAFYLNAAADAVEAAGKGDNAQAQWAADFLGL